MRLYLKRLFYNAVVILFTVSDLFSQTSIPAGIVKGNWTVSGSPYNIQGNIEITTGDSLVIQPGVTIDFKGPYKLMVSGRLKAIGKINDTITFTAEDPIEGWGGVRINSFYPGKDDTSRLVYCKFENGKAEGIDKDGGAICIFSFSKVVISNSAIINCTSDSYGGGVYSNLSGMVFKNNSISNCRALNRGGAIYIQSGNPLIYGNVIKNNTSLFQGGAIYVGNGNPIIDNNTITDNTSSGEGGGIYIFDGGAVISRNNILNGKASSGAGIFINNTKSAVDINNNNISKNNASTGGGIVCTGSAIINKNIIFSNTASNGAGGIHCTTKSSVIISNNTISNNTVNLPADTNHIGGGGIYLTNGSQMFVYNNVIINNSSGNGGGIACFKSSPAFTNNTIANNNATEKGGAVYCYNSSPVFRNCIMWGNKATTDGNQVFLSDKLSQPDFFYCNIMDSNAFGLTGAAYTGTYSKNISGDPLFVSPTPGTWTGYDGNAANWSLKSKSPCIDAGDPSQTYELNDIGGDKRVRKIIDIGAYEFNESLVVNTITEYTIVNIHPNPSTGKFTLETNQISNYEIEIFSSTGERIFTTAKSMDEPSKEIDLSFAARGMYFIKIYNKRGIFLQKILLY